LNKTIAPKLNIIGDGLGKTFLTIADDLLALPFGNKIERNLDD
jgi:hypothetical protein